MKLGLLGGGTIARLVLEHLREGLLGNWQVVAVAGRSANAKAGALAGEYALPFVDGGRGLEAAGAEVVLEAASHDAVREHLVWYLDHGISVIVLSAGALADDGLRADAEAAARRSGARLYVPSGGIGSLDALKAAVVAGVEEVTIQVAKPPAAWRGIPYVAAAGIELDALQSPTVLFSGTAREGVPHFPANVNIAAVLALAGIGFDRTRLEVVADPALVRNTHTIRVSGRTGRFQIVLENDPAPENPKTAWLACYSALAALRALGSESIRYGT